MTYGGHEFLTAGKSWLLPGRALGDVHTPTAGQEQLEAAPATS